MNVGADNIFPFKDNYLKLTPDSAHSYSQDLKSKGLPLIIDNGSCFSRAGWACESSPRLSFRNVIARQRGKKDSEAQIGNDIPNIETVRWLLKTQFDRDVVTHYDAQEQILDHTFQRLGIDSEGAVQHPVVMTEAPCNPNICRQTMSELLFECYQIPSLAYGIDSLFSLYYNCPEKSASSCSLILSSGFQTTHVLPVINGQLDAANCRRLNIGGSHLTSYLLRLLQLKYPAHQSHLNLSRAEELLMEHSYTAVDPWSEFEDWKSQDYFDKHAHRMQLPYTPLPGWSVGNTKERRRQCISRLQDLNKKWRQEKLTGAEEKLRSLVNIQNTAEDSNDTQKKMLRTLGLNSLDDLKGYIGMLNASIQRAKVSLGGRESIVDQPTSVNVWPSLDLLGSDQELLSQAERNAVRRQELVEAFHQNSLRARWVQQEIDGLLQEGTRLVGQGSPKEGGLKRWTEQLKEQKEELGTCHAQWQHIKESLLGLQEPKDADTMDTDQEGDNDETTAGDQGSEWAYIQAMEDDAEGFSFEAEQENLSELDKILSVFDQEVNKENRSPVGQRMTFDLAEYYQVVLGVERIRGPEILFQPSIMGLEQGGLGETMEHVLRLYEPEVQNKLVQNVFLTGGNLNFPNMVERIETELRAMRPFQSSFKVRRAGNPSLDAWLGAAKWATDPANQSLFISRAEYEEKGGDYLKEHHASNRSFSAPGIVLGSRR
ncbi:actin-related protein 5-like [Diadema setosum]|uniref:actin-related protein 5-like n=1 Tax=Diadema setosum TaxID=31175 RepID=UPI003B3B7795